jgi:glycosyltransferase involved in cell wall biosynthesis
VSSTSGSNQRNRLASAVFGRAHHQLRDWLWRYGHLLARNSPAAEGIPNRVLHVTSSFDLGGTQTQIKHLATAPSTRFEHRVTEIFPELNYLFREGECLDPGRYVRGNAVARAVGRNIMNRNRRGYELVQVAKIVRDVEAERPGALIGWGHEICVTTFLAALAARIPHVVFCIRTFNPACWADAARASVLHAAHRWMAPRASAIIANSTILREDYAGWASISADAVSVCSNGVSLDVPTESQLALHRTQVRASLGIAPDTFVVTNIARFSVEKGQRMIVDANALLPPEVRDRVTWLLCGDGPTLETIRTLASAQGTRNLQFTGRTTRVWETLAASDAFVMPSDYEGMPNAMMEAMAVGLPCVSTTRSGIRDVARDGTDALYVVPGDAAALAARVQWLVQHPQLAAAIGQSAAQRVREFSVARLVSCFEDTLAKSLQTPAVAAA